MKKTLLSAVLALSLGLMSQAHAQLSPVKVNGQTISKVQLEQLALQAIQNNDPHKIIDPKFEDGVTKMAIEHTVLAQDAKREGLDKLPEVQQAIDNNTKFILADYYRQKEWLKHPIGDFEMDKAYNEFRREYGKEEVQFRAIVLDSEAKAKEVLAQLQKGANFAKVAAAKTLDTAVADKGGLYSWRSLNMLPDNLKDKLAKAKKDELIPTVIKLENGWAVVKAEGIRSAENIPEFKKVSKELHDKLQRERNQSIAEALIKKTGAKVTNEAQLIDLYAKEARQLGYDKLDDVKANIANMKAFVLSQALTQKVMASFKVTDQELKATYEEAKAKAGGKDVRIRNIVVNDEAKAKKIIERLKHGESFDKIAVKESSDPSTKDVGGLLDWMPLNRFTQSLRDAIEHMKPGEVYDKPIQSSVGWHVIRLEDERAHPFADFNAVKDNVKATVLQRKYAAWVQTKIGASDIEQEGGQSAGKLDLKKMNMPETVKP